MLKDYAEAFAAAEAHEALRDRLNRAHGRLGDALGTTAADAPEGMASRLRSAEASLAQLGAALRARDILATRQETLLARSAALQRERQSVDAVRAMLDQDGRSISEEGAVPPGPDALDAAVDALSAAAADVVTRAGVVRQIEGMSKDKRRF